MKVLSFSLIFVIMVQAACFECFASSGGIPMSSQNKQTEVAPQAKSQEPAKISQTKPEAISKPVESKPIESEPVKLQPVEPKPLKVKVQPVQPKVQPQVQPKPALTREQQLELERKRALVAKKKEALNNTEWEVVMNPLSGKGKKIEDTIIFYEGKVRLKELNEQGFPATNYTLTLQEDNKVVWETMQTADKEVVFFRGEVSANMDNMNGIVSFQRLEGNQDYNFASIKKRQISSTELE